MDLQIKVMMRNGPRAILCDWDSPITYWDEPGDTNIPMVYRDRWNPALPSPSGGQFESVVTQSTVDAARAQLEALVGRRLPLVVCVSMRGRIEQ